MREGVGKGSSLKSAEYLHNESKGQIFLFHGSQSDSQFGRNRYDTFTNFDL